jgi:hypothetical protein
MAVETLVTSMSMAFSLSCVGAQLWRIPIQCSASTRMQTNLPSDGAVEFDEEMEPDVFEDNDDDAAGGQDQEAQDQEDNIVVSGDASAATAAKDKVKNTVENEKDKKVAPENRTTTPYMTKYERARVLGTRALQIRWVIQTPWS